MSEESNRIAMGAGFKALRQGEVTQYTELLEDSRRHAIDRLPCCC